MPCYRECGECVTRLARIERTRFQSHHPRHERVHRDHAPTEMLGGNDEHRARQAVPAEIGNRRRVRCGRLRLPVFFPLSPGLLGVFPHPPPTVSLLLPPPPFLYPRTLP